MEIDKAYGMTILDHCPLYFFTRCCERRAQAKRLKKKKRKTKTASSKLNALTATSFICE